MSEMKLYDSQIDVKNTSIDFYPPEEFHTSNVIYQEYLINEEISQPIIPGHLSPESLLYHITKNEDYFTSSFDYLEFGFFDQCIDPYANLYPLLYKVYAKISEVCYHGN